MPIYEFECKKCGTIFEALMPRRENNPKGIKCIKCNGIAKIIEISKSNFHLKGGGWAEDGYANKN
jgi:putative FmdB family regulatory protein